MEALQGRWLLIPCNNGYKGQVGLYQVMPISEEIQRIILTQGTRHGHCQTSSPEGVRDLRDQVWSKSRSAPPL